MNRLGRTMLSTRETYAEFAARIWDTILPNGVVLREATRKDLMHAAGFFAQLGQGMGPTDKIEPGEKD
jgi:hypothetical protein